MAQRISVSLVDDLDGTEATETVVFSVDGREFEIDLNEAHASSLREGLEPFVSAARPVQKRRQRRQRPAVLKEVPVHAAKKAPAKKASAKKATAKRGTSKPSPKEVREWARTQGLPVGEKGPMKRSLFQQYAEAHS